MLSFTPPDKHKRGANRVPCSLPAVIPSEVEEFRDIT